MRLGTTVEFVDFSLRPPCHPCLPAFLVLSLPLLFLPLVPCLLVFFFLFSLLCIFSTFFSSSSISSFLFDVFLYLHLFHILHPFLFSHPSLPCLLVFFISLPLFHFLHIFLFFHPFLPCLPVWPASVRLTKVSCQHERSEKRSTRSRTDSRDWTLRTRRRDGMECKGGRRRRRGKR